MNNIFLEIIQNFTEENSQSQQHQVHFLFFYAKKFRCFHEGLFISRKQLLLLSLLFYKRNRFLETKS